MLQYQYQLIVRSLEDFIRRGIGSDFVSTATAKTNYLKALENKHLRELFRVEELPLYTERDNNSKKCKWDWKDPNSPKHLAYIRASNLDLNRNFRCAMQFLPYLFEAKLAACNNDWAEVFRVLRDEAEAEEERDNIDDSDSE